MNKAHDYDAVWRHTDALDWCVLLTTGRTGSDLFQSLLDSHPQIFVFNGVLQFGDFWTSTPCVTYGGPLQADDIADAFIGRHLHNLKSRYDVVERKNELGDDRKGSIDIDPTEFRSHVLSLLHKREITQQNFLRAVYVSYALCLGHDVMDKRVFLHHVHRVARGYEFAAEMPGCRLLAMTRDPRAAYVSGVDNWRRAEPRANNPGYPLYVLQRVVDEPLVLREYGDQARMVRLEDLGDPGVMSAVAGWLGVDVHPCLRESTWAGLRWWGDRLSSRQIPEDERGFSRTMSTSGWERRLGAFDRYVLKYLLCRVLMFHRYEPIPEYLWFHRLILPLAILVPTNYERADMAPKRLWENLTQGQARALVLIPYHYLRRVRYFISLYRRNLFDGYHGLPSFRPDETPPAC